MTVEKTKNFNIKHAKSGDVKIDAFANLYVFDGTQWVIAHHYPSANIHDGLNVIDRNKQLKSSVRRFLENV